VRRPRDSALLTALPPAGVLGCVVTNGEMDDGTYMQQYMADASANAELLRRMNEKYGPEQMLELVRSTGIIDGDDDEDPGEERVAAALLSAGYRKTAMLCELDAVVLQAELKEQGVDLRPIVVRTLINQILIDPHVAYYRDLRELATSRSMSAARSASRRPGQQGVATGRGRPFLVSESPYDMHEDDAS